MKRTISLWLGLLAFVLVPVFAQTPAVPKGATGKIHGHVTNPTGAGQNGGTVTLVGVGRVAAGPGMSAQMVDKGVFQVDENGDYAGPAVPGMYSVVYRNKDMKPDQTADRFDDIKIVAGQDTLLDFDMSRKAYIDRLPADQQKQLAELRKKNAEIMKVNDVIKNVNNDLKVAAQDFKDSDSARDKAKQLLGPAASKADLDAKEIEIKTAKNTEVETLMLKDSAAKPDASVIWAQLGQAQLGLAELAPVDDRPAKYAQAEATYKKVLEVEAASKKPNPAAQGAANAGLGEIYARTGKIPEAAAAYDAAAKINPSQASFYFKNEAVIYYQLRNAGSPYPGLGDAQAAAADEAIKADPNMAIVYYLKGHGLVEKATIDTKTQMYILPPGCAEAYQKYLQLAPNGQFARDAKDLLAQAAGSKTQPKGR
jgi:tetratricopeptide (TPR) repeat protein